MGVGADFVPGDHVAGAVAAEHGVGGVVGQGGVICFGHAGVGLPAGGVVVQPTGQDAPAVGGGQEVGVIAAELREGRRADSIASAFIFGIIYSVSLTPCIGAFLGSALMMAGTAGTALKGVMLLIFYSIGLGLPFLISAVLLGRLKTAFDFIKRHYNVINIVCGCLLIVLGILMMCGLMNRILGALI